MNQRDSKFNVEDGLSTTETQNVAEDADTEADGIPAQILAVVGADPRKAAKFEKRMAAANIREQALESLGVTAETVEQIRRRMERGD